MPIAQLLKWRMSPANKPSDCKKLKNPALWPDFLFEVKKSGFVMEVAIETIE